MRSVCVVLFVLLASVAQAQQPLSLLATVQRLRAEYPTPMSRAHVGELLNRVAWEHRSEGWGLLKKTGGSRCPAPHGVDISCDILIHAPSLQHFDILSDAEGAATPAWRSVGPCVLGPSSGCDMANYLAPQPLAGAPPVSVSVPVQPSQPVAVSPDAFRAWAADFERWARDFAEWSRRQTEYQNDQLKAIQDQNERIYRDVVARIEASSQKAPIEPVKVDQGNARGIVNLILGIAGAVGGGIAAVR